MDRSRLQQFMSTRLAELPLVDPLFVSPSTPVNVAVARMRDGSRAFVLAGSAENVEGIFTERDVLTKCMEEGFEWAQPLERAVLTREVRTIASSATVGDAIASMRQHRYRTLPVMDGVRVVGLVRLQDLLRHLAEEFPEDVLNIPPRPHQAAESREGG